MYRQTSYATDWGISIKKYEIVIKFDVNGNEFKTIPMKMSDPVLFNTIKKTINQSIKTEIKEFGGNVSNRDVWFEFKVHGIRFETSKVRMASTKMAREIAFADKDEFDFP